jgi:hypothetical protein
MIPNEPDAPWWATEVERPDPGVVEFLRPMGSVMCGDSREEVVVYLTQRDMGPIKVSFAGVGCFAFEADLICQILSSATSLAESESSAKDPVSAEGLRRPRIGGRSHGAFREIRWRRHVRDRGTA